MLGEASYTVKSFLTLPACPSVTTTVLSLFQGELLCILNSLDYARRSKLYSIELSNPANMSFSYYYYLIFVPGRTTVYIKQFRLR